MEKTEKFLSVSCVASCSNPSGDHVLSDSHIFGFCVRGRLIHSRAGEAIKIEL
jgi:hypothetical protein